MNLIDFWVAQKVSISMSMSLVYLSRETDRLLNRLERLQRMRKRGPLPSQDS
jgi:hypothetical protein